MYNFGFLLYAHNGTISWKLLSEQLTSNLKSVALEKTFNISFLSAARAAVFMNNLPWRGGTEVLWTQFYILGEIWELKIYGKGEKFENIELTQRGIINIW